MLDEADWNLSQISELTERMAQIGQQLKAFSRKSTGDFEVISLRGSIDGALEILAPAIKKSDVDLFILVPSKKKYDEIIIGIGSSQYSHSTDNPFSADERKEMIMKRIADAFPAARRQTGRWQEP